MITRPCKYVALSRYYWLQVFENVCWLKAGTRCLWLLWQSLFYFCPMPQIYLPPSSTIFCNLDISCLGIFLLLDSYIEDLVLSMTDNWEGHGTFNRCDSWQEVVSCSGYSPRGAVMGIPVSSCVKAVIEAQSWHFPTHDFLLCHVLFCHAPEYDTARKNPCNSLHYSLLLLKVWTIWASL